MKFSCDHCGRAYSVSGALAGHSFRMRCRACGHVISVRGASDGGPLPGGDEPLGGATSSSPGPRRNAAPPQARDENPFETQPISIAAVRATLDAQERKKALEAGPASSTGLPGSSDLVLGREIAGPGSQPVSTPPPPPQGSTEAASAGTPVEQQPAEDPFAGWDADDQPAPPPAPPEAASVAEGRPATRVPVESRPPADRPAKREGSRLMPVLAAVAAVAVAVILLLMLCAASRPPAGEARPAAPQARR